LNRPRSSNSTWHHRYDALVLFFKFFQLRGNLKNWPMPSRAPRHDKTFVPYIYSRAEIARLVSDASLQRIASSHPRRLEPETLRALLLFLYATGVSVGEALTLKINNVDLKRDLVTVGRHEVGRMRTIPIGHDVHKLLLRYLNSSSPKTHRNGHVFVNRTGAKISPVTLMFTFRRLCQRSGIARPGGTPCQPRMHDLRFTFAVHRIASWYTEGADVPKMIPALGAYMGHVGLRAVGRYLSLTPDHFRKLVVGPHRIKRNAVAKTQSQAAPNLLLLAYPP
jgi:integrase/recombinase XerD